VEHQQCLIDAGASLLQLYDLMDESPRFPAFPVCHKMLALGLRHIRLVQTAGVHLIPKHHLMVHMLRGTPKTGNPKYVATFFDESLNSLLSQLGAKAHALVWEQRVFANFEALAPQKGTKRLKSG